MLHTNDLISIILPCYNVEKYVLRCIHSIEVQTYGVNNIEIVAVNDASTDNTISILQAYKDQHPNNFILVNLTKNKGQGAARNIGMDYATGKYIMFVDSDDMIDATMLEKMHSAIIAQNYNEVQCGFKSFVKEEECTPVKGNHSFYKKCKNLRSDRVDVMMGSYTTVWARLYETSYLKSNKLRFIEGITCEDNHFVIMDAILLDSYFYLDEKLYYYYDNPCGISKNSIDLIKIRDHLKACDYVIEELKERRIYEQVMEEFGDEIRGYHIWHGFVETVNNVQIEMNKEIAYYKSEILKRYPDALNNKYINNPSSEYIRQIVKKLES